MKLFVESIVATRRVSRGWGIKQGLIANRRIDTRVYCPAEMHIRLYLLPDRKFRMVTKFGDSHSHDLSSSERCIIFIGQEFTSEDEIYNFYNAYVKNNRFGVRKKE